MKHYTHDRGIQASAATGVVLAVVSIVGYSPALLAVWAVWAALTVWAVSIVARRAA